MGEQLKKQFGMPVRSKYGIGGMIQGMQNKFSHSVGCQAWISYCAQRESYSMQR